MAATRPRRVRNERDGVRVSRPRDAHAGDPGDEGIGGRLAEILSRIDSLSKRHGLDYANCFHAGDGNLHPMVLFDSAKPGDLEKAEAFGADILRACVDLGGVLSGEHGIGVEKRDLMPYQFEPNDLELQQRLKCAFDPGELLNPGKVFPTPCRCVELGRLRIRDGNLRFADVPRS